MKKLGFSILFFLTITVGFSQVEQDVIVWQESFSKAKKIAKKEDKVVLLYFTGSDWCGPCKKLVIDFFESEKFKEIAAKSLVLYEANFPRNKDLVTIEQSKTNMRLSKKYDVTTFPVLVLLNKNGEMMREIRGYNLMRDPSYHFKFIENALK